MGTRLYIVDIGKLHTPWAPQVVDLKIGGRIHLSETQLHTMAAMPWCVFGGLLAFTSAEQPAYLVAGILLFACLVMTFGELWQCAGARGFARNERNLERGG